MTARTTPGIDATTNHEKDSEDSAGKDDDVKDNDGNIYLGATGESEHLCLTPCPSKIACTIARFVGARLFFHQAVLCYIPCLVQVAPAHSNATPMGVL